MSILDKIVATKRQEIAAAKTACPETVLRNALPMAPVVRDFQRAIAACDDVALIAEIKKASPSAGVIRSDFCAVEIATTYETHGATCLSVLTDAPYFQGHLDFLRDVRATVGIPILRKDFILDPYQLVEARVAGADAVLLIAECLDDPTLRRLIEDTMALGMTPLVELYEPDNLSRVLDAGAELIGVNNRNLRTFVTDLEHTLRIRSKIPDRCSVVAESGIGTPDDVQRLREANVDAMLVGESLMREPDIGAAVDALLRRSL